MTNERAIKAIHYFNCSCNYNHNKFFPLCYCSTMTMTYITWLCVKVINLLIWPTNIQYYKQNLNT